MSDRIDPRRPYKVWLDEYNDWLESERPTFTYRRMSGSEYMDICDAYDGMNNDALTMRERITGLFRATRVGLIGWENQINLETGDKQPFDIALLESVIDHTDADQLIGKRVLGGRLSPDDKKKSAS